MWLSVPVRQAQGQVCSGALAVWLQASFLTSLSLCSLVVVVITLLPMNPVIRWMRTDQEKGDEVLSTQHLTHTWEVTRLWLGLTAEAGRQPAQG